MGKRYALIYLGYLQFRRVILKTDTYVLTSEFGAAGAIVARFGHLVVGCAALRFGKIARNTGSPQPIIKMFVAIRARTFYSLRMDLFPSTPGRQPK